MATKGSTTRIPDPKSVPVEDRPKAAGMTPEADRKLGPQPVPTLNGPRVVIQPPTGQRRRKH